MREEVILTDHQIPLGSGFGVRSTAAQVLEGVNVAGKLAIVTGGHSGIGLETTRALSRAGADVIVPARNTEQARAALKGFAGVTVETLDLSDLDSVCAIAERILGSGRHVDMLINNAGVMVCPEGRVGAGWDTQFATNHFGHFALTNLLWPALKGGSRVVALSSAGHHSSPIRWDDVHFDRGYDKRLAYGQSKTANALFAVEFDRLARNAGVRAFSVHPGKILTPLQRHMTREEMMAAGWVDASGALADPTFKTTEQGAATTVWAATTPQLDGLGGLYCEDCDVALRAENAGAPYVGVRDYATDSEEGKRLWAYSRDATGIDAF